LLLPQHAVIPTERSDEGSAVAFGEFKAAILPNWPLHDRDGTPNLLEALHLLSPEVSETNQEMSSE